MVLWVFSVFVIQLQFVVALGALQVIQPGQAHLGTELETLEHALNDSCFSFLTVLRRPNEIQSCDTCCCWRTSTFCAYMQHLLNDKLIVFLIITPFITCKKQNKTAET